MPRLKSRILISQSCLWTWWWRTWCWQLWKVGEDQWADACTGISVSGSLFPILRMPTFSEDIGMEESWGFVQISDILCSRNPLQGRFQESEKPFTLTIGLEIEDRGVMNMLMAFLRSGLAVLRFQPQLVLQLMPNLTRLESSAGIPALHETRGLNHRC